jgi:hypothetical protein
MFADRRSSFMARMYLVLSLSAVLCGILPASRALAQGSKAAPAAAHESSAQVDVLPGLPRPPDAPASLLKEPPAAPPYTCDPLPGPYFEHDPMLDPPFMPQPGWVFDVELGIVGPHVKNRLRDIVQVGTAPPDTLHLPSATLDWTVAPRVEAGYRLPSGFGEFVFAYRFLSSEGTGTFLGPDALSTVKSRLDINVVDLDYASREFFTLQWPYVGMKWRFGLRWADAFFDSRSDEPFAAAATGTGVFERRTSNNFWGIGPHLGLELTRHLHQWGLDVVGRIDAATLLGRIHQDFFEESTTPIGNGQLLAGNTRLSVSQDVPMIYAFIGLGWRPPSCPCLSVYAGYEYEYWWNLGRNSNTTSRGELSDQGVLLQAAFNW